MAEALNQLSHKFSQIKKVRRYGKVSDVAGLMIYCIGLEKTAIGSRCEIEDIGGDSHAAEVVGFKEGKTLVMPFGNIDGIGPGCRVYIEHVKPIFMVGDCFVGRVINALGDPIDGKGGVAMGTEEKSLKSKPPAPGKRRAVGGKLDVGVRSINTFLPICEGQRMGIFSGSGVGKSVLMSMIARFSSADINIIALVGERGREVKEFIEEQLGEEGLKRSVVVVATGDEPALMRRQAAYLAMTLAEYFRDQGKKVLLFMDSVTRFAMAQREVGLSAGEPPTTKGYTPSVFSELPRLLERAGPGESEGSITAIFTVLVEGSDMDEPVADAVRGIIDGHIVLERSLAERGHFPAIDILKSVSRMLPDCHTGHENRVMNEARQSIATYANMEELIRLGAYKEGSDPAVDTSIRLHDALEDFLIQKPSESSPVDQGFNDLAGIMGQHIAAAEHAVEE